MLTHPHHNEGLSASAPLTVDPGPRIVTPPPGVSPPPTPAVGPAPHHFAPLVRWLSHVPSFLSSDLMRDGYGTLKRAPFGASIDLDPNSPVAAYDTAPYLLGAKAYSGALLGRMAALGPVVDKFWLGLSPHEGAFAPKEVTPAVQLFHLRYQQYALDLIRNHCGQNLMEVLRSAGASMVRCGIQRSSALPQTDEEQSAALGKLKAGLVDDGVPLVGGGHLRIAPPIVNFLSPRLERLADFVAQINSDLGIQDFSVQRGELSTSVLGVNSGRALVYHLALVLGALAKDDYAHLHTTCAPDSSLRRHFGEVLAPGHIRLLGDVQYDAWLKRKAVERGGEYHEAFQRFLIERAVPKRDRLFLQEVTLQHLDALLACGEKGLAYWADIGQKLAEHGINLNPELHKGLARGAIARDGTPVYVCERMMDLAAFNRHAAWLRAREICALQPLTEYHPAPHPADVRWNPREMPTDALYDPDRLGALTFAHSLHKLRISASGDEAALYGALADLADQAESIRVPAPKLPLHVEIGTETLAIDPDTIQALTLVRRLVGHTWREGRDESMSEGFACTSASALRDSLSAHPAWETAWVNVKPHQRLFEVLYTLTVAEEARKFSPKSVHALKVFASWVRNASNVASATNYQGGVRITGTRDGKESAITLSAEVGKELFSAFEKGRILAQEQAITVARALKNPELLRNRTLSGDLDRLERELKSPVPAGEAAARTLERVGAYARSLGEAPQFAASVFDSVFYRSGRPGLQVRSSLYKAFTLSETRAFGFSFLQLRDELEDRMRSDSRSHDWNDKAPLSRLGAEFMSAQLMVFLVGFGQAELEDLRRTGQRFERAEQYNSVRVLVDQHWAERVGMRPGPLPFKVAWPHPLIRNAMLIHVDRLQIRSMEILEAVGSVAFGKSSQAFVGANNDAKAGLVWYPHSARLGVSLSLHALCSAIAELSEDSFGRLLECSYDSGVRIPEGT